MAAMISIWCATSSFTSHWANISSQLQLYSILLSYILDGNWCQNLLSGNGGLTFAEAKSHFTAWALMKSPLLVRSTFLPLLWINLLIFLLIADRNQRELQQSLTRSTQMTFRNFTTQLSAITPDILGILTNKEILAINQDSVEGASISPFRWGINVRTHLYGLALHAQLINVN